jgi:RHH-type proline utilization regulon transcriptional repressor/proline dehydrogenase/delta 1-pyrroline-5-carboxylate dehydrogenase
MGPSAEAAAAQKEAVLALGGTAIEANGLLDLHRLEFLKGFSGVLWWGDEDTARRIEQTLAKRNGPIIPLIPGKPDPARVLAERHVCVDTTAAGGNAALLGGSA